MEDAKELNSHPWKSRGEKASYTAQHRHNVDACPCVGISCKIRNVKKTAGIPSESRFVMSCNHLVGSVADATSSLSTRDLS